MDQSTTQQSTASTSIPSVWTIIVITVVVTLFLVGATLLVFFKLNPSQNTDYQTLLQADIQKLQLDILDLQNQINANIRIDSVTPSTTITPIPEQLPQVNYQDQFEMGCTALGGEVRLRSLGVEEDDEDGMPFCIFANGIECSENEVLQGYCRAR